MRIHRIRRTLHGLIVKDLILHKLSHRFAHSAHHLHHRTFHVGQHHRRRLSNGFLGQRMRKSLLHVKIQLRASLHEYERLRRQLYRTRSYRRRHDLRMRLHSIRRHIHGLFVKDLILHKMSHRFAHSAHHLRYRTFHVGQHHHRRHHRRFSSVPLRQRMRKSLLRIFIQLRRSLREYELLRRQLHRTRSYSRRHYLQMRLHHVGRIMHELFKDLILLHRFAHNAHHLHYRTFHVGQHHRRRFSSGLLRQRMRKSLLNVEMRLRASLREYGRLRGQLYRTRSYRRRHYLRMQLHTVRGRIQGLFVKDLILHKLSHRFAHSAHHSHYRTFHVGQHHRLRFSSGLLRQRMRKSLLRVKIQYRASLREYERLRRQLYRTQSSRRRHYLRMQLHSIRRRIQGLFVEDLMLHNVYLRIRLHHARRIMHALLVKDLILSHRFTHSQHHRRRFSSGLLRQRMRKSLLHVNIQLGASLREYERLRMRLHSIRGRIHGLVVKDLVLHKLSHRFAHSAHIGHRFGYDGRPFWRSNDGDARFEGDY